MQTKITSVRIPGDMYVLLRSAALIERKSISTVIVEAVERALEPAGSRESDES
jgi:uncharacterized protein (DUF1778 family)